MEGIHHSQVLHIVYLLKSFFFLQVTEHFDKVMYVHSTDTEIFNKYHLSCCSLSNKAAAEFYLHYTFYLHLQQHFSLHGENTLPSLPSRPRCVRLKKTVIRRFCKKYICFASCFFFLFIKYRLELVALQRHNNIFKY